MSESTTSKRVFAVLLVLACVMLLYGRIPGLTNDFCDPDLAGISYGARDLLRGGTIYERCVETKPPGAYLIFATSFALGGHRLTPIYLLATLLHLLTLLAVARMAQRAAGPAAAIAAAWFYAALAIDSAAAANCPNYESWMSFFVAFGLLAISPTRVRLSARRLLLAGAALGVALTMKQQAALFALVGGLWIATSHSGKWKASGRDLAWYALGFAAPLILLVATWAVMGGLGAMLTDLHPGRLQSYFAAGQGPEAMAMMAQRVREHLAGGWLAWLSVLGGVVFLLVGVSPR
ncbi:MAG: glycosyltransferase family 39 protein, partial [Alphaproteobacteria bacterium]